MFMNLKLTDPIEMEIKINQIVGVVTNGLFAVRPANILLLATNEGVQDNKERCLIALNLS